MRVRYHDRTDIAGHSNQFNIHSAGEVIVHFDAGDSTSEYIRALDVLLPDDVWKPMSNAFRDRDIIPDNQNVYFSVPVSQTEKDRGYSL